MPGSNACLGPIWWILSIHRKNYTIQLYFPGGSDSKESACNAGDPGSILGWEDPLGKGMATHSSSLAWRIPMDRGVWWAYVNRLTESQTRLSTKTFIHVLIRTKVQLGVWNDKGGGDVRKSWEERWDDTSSQTWILPAQGCSMPSKWRPEAEKQRCLWLCLFITTENTRLTVKTYIWLLSNNRLINKGLWRFFLTQEQNTKELNLKHII